MVLSSTLTLECRHLLLEAFLLTTSLSGFDHSRSNIAGSSHLKGCQSSVGFLGEWTKVELSSPSSPLGTQSRPLALLTSQKCRLQKVSSFQMHSFHLGASSLKDEYPLNQPVPSDVYFLP